MRRTRRMTAIILALSFALAGCQAGGAGGAGGVGTATAVGGLGGAAAGGLLGAALGGGATGIAAGTILGGLLGAGTGYVLDQRSRHFRRRRSVGRSRTSSGTSAAWTNPDNGNQGTVTPVRTYQNQAGAYCREFQQTIVVGSQTQQGYGTACRQPDGSWRMVN